ncbi:sulfurtransferase TusA family protein [uncultured Devosia sp.]|uniref:sulfurtransferase TusA family protein n=1 Tax=uncultured Devosia sp. TaxID=211434 RepID=UPI0035CCA4E9
MPAPVTASIGSWFLATETLDARGLKCPLPVLKMEKRLEGLPPGAVLAVLATDPIARIDIPLYCRQHGHPCVFELQGDAMQFTITKG